MGVQKQAKGTRAAEETYPVIRNGSGALRPTEPDENLVGRIFEGRYQITRLIASGTMGQVYLAVHLRLDRPVAVKIMSQSGGLADERFAKRFCREASIASQLSHPNIVSVFDYGETEDGKLYMVMEYIEGEPLSAILEREAPLPPERVLAIAIQIARALRRAHQVGVVHRDLKPANVMVRTDEEGFVFVKVLDFGLVKLFAPEAGEISSPYDEDDLTRPGNMVGTPEYVSPEQGLGDEVDARTDIYSLGVLLFFMISGRLPYLGTTIVELLQQHLDAPIPWISDVSTVECPPDVEGIIRRAMNKLRNERQSSMDEFLDSLKMAWRNLTDESYGTGVLQSVVIEAVILTPFDDGRTDDMQAARPEAFFAPEAVTLTNVRAFRRFPRVIWAFLLLAVAAAMLTVALIMAEQPSTQIESSPPPQLEEKRMAPDPPLPVPLRSVTPDKVNRRRNGQKRTRGR